MTARSEAIGPRGMDIRGADRTARSQGLAFFDDVVRACGGKTEKLLQAVGLNRNVCNQRDARIPYRKAVALLNKAAGSLGCLDIGMRLAARQAPGGAGGPLSLAMINSRTMREGFQYCDDHSYIYSPSTRLISIEDPETNLWTLQFEILEQGIDDPRQMVEYAILSTHLIAIYMSRGRVKPLEIWLKHGPISSVNVYDEYFDSNVCFARSIDAIIFKLEDASMPIEERDEDVYQLAKDFNDMRFAKPDLPIDTKVRGVLKRCRGIGDVQTSDVASALGMHPRTFQRRLRDAGLRFDQIKDEVRRERALRYLRYTEMPLIRIANMLGYSELSGFSRSCRRWFSSTPRALRLGGDQKLPRP